MKRVFDATDCEGECAAAMRKSNAQLWEPFEYAPKDHRANCERRFGRHANEPRQPVFRHTLSAEHVPGMNEDRCVELFSCAPHGLK